MREKLMKVLRDINKDIPDDSSVDLLKTRLLDSFDMVNLVSAIEENFEIELNPEDILPENFRTIGDIEKLVSRYKK